MKMHQSVKQLLFKQCLFNPISGWSSHFYFIFGRSTFQTEKYFSYGKYLLFYGSTFPAHHQVHPQKYTFCCRNWYIHFSRQKRWSFLTRDHQFHNLSLSSRTGIILFKKCTMHCGNSRLQIEFLTKSISFYFEKARESLFLRNNPSVVNVRGTS